MKKAIGQLGAWLDLLGESKAALSRRFGLSNHAIGVTIITGHYGPWLTDLAEYIGVPLDMLLNEHPLSTNPDVKRIAGQAVARAAVRRLRPVPQVSRREPSRARSLGQQFRYQRRATQ